MTKWLIIFVMLLLPTASGHGVLINYVIDGQSGDIILNAKFDSGELMDEAQVSVFAPSDLLNPWIIDTTDELGNYRFKPDLSLLGTWEVQIRKAGHGEIVRIEVDEGLGAIVQSSTSRLAGFTTLQLMVMSLSIIWGCVGTALYFKSRQQPRPSTAPLKVTEWHS